MGRNSRRPAWRSIPGTGGLVRISSEGKVWSRKRNRELKGSVVNGIRYFSINGTLVPHGGLMLMAWKGTTGECCVHLDGDHTNVDPENLKWVSRSEASGVRT